MTQLHELTASDLLAGYRSKAFSPVETMKAVLARIAAVDSQINAFSLVDADAAIARARESEARWLSGMPMGALDGVPVSIKDLLLTKGWPNLWGSLTADSMPGQIDAPSVARLREAGATLFGKTNTPEFGHKGVTDSRRHGITRNPWNLAMTPGGSSVGSSAALAAGMGPLSLATDGGGSARTPANFAGVVGFKPTHGRIPVFPASTWGQLTTPGVMARSVEDVARMMSVVSRPDLCDPLARPDNDQDYLASLNGGVKGLRVAVSMAMGHGRVDAEVAALVRKAAQRFEDLGALVEEKDPVIADPFPIFLGYMLAGVAYSVGLVPADRRHLLEPLVLQMYEAGKNTLATDYVRNTKDAADLTRALHLFHQDYDLLVTPTNSVAAFPAGQNGPNEDREGPLVSWSPGLFPLNLAGAPGISVPCGHTKTGLPVGLQIAAARGRDDLVLRAANTFESTTGLMNQRAPI